MPNYLDVYNNKQIKLTESKDLGYKLYTFTPLPLSSLKLSIENELMQLLIDAHRSLGEVKGMLSCIENNDFIVKLLKINESVASCKIDNIDIDYLTLFSGNRVTTTPDIDKVRKYYQAMGFTKGKSLTQKSLTDLHTSIMANDEVEYWNKQQRDFLGSIRTVQTYLSLKQGISVVNELKYNPTPPDHLHDLLDEMLKYYQKNMKYDLLIKSALIHYQFASLHPFLGGNGRIGRLLIHKMLIGNGLMNYSVLPFSEYLVQNKVEYFDRLWSAQCSMNLAQWVKFFLIGIVNSAELTIKRINQYIAVRKKDMKAIADSEKYRLDMMTIYRYLENNIAINIKTAAEVLSVSFNTASKIVGRLAEIGILTPLDCKKRYKVYVYSIVGEILN